MKLTTKGRYAVTAMLDLALHNDKGPVPLAEISVRQGISLSYLEQLFARLRKKNLVNSTRGPGGGYSLSKSVSKIAIADIILAVDEKVEPAHCGKSKDCADNENCLTHSLWAALSEQIRQFLSEITLANVMSRASVQEVAQRQDHVTQHQIHFQGHMESPASPDGPA